MIPHRAAARSRASRTRSPVMSENAQVLPKVKKSVALSGVAAGNTAICTVGRSGNDLHYRGYDIHDLATRASFEEVAHLLIGLSRTTANLPSTGASRVPPSGVGT